MAQDITIAGASYPDVPGIDVPKTGGGTARFLDTSDANAQAGDIAQGKTAYVNGTKLTGTNSGSGGSSGTLVVPVTLPISLFEDGAPADVTMPSGTVASILAALEAGQIVNLALTTAGSHEAGGTTIDSEQGIFMPVKLVTSYTRTADGEDPETVYILFGSVSMSGAALEFEYFSGASGEVFHFSMMHQTEWGTRIQATEVRFDAPDSETEPDMTIGNTSFFRVGDPADMSRLYDAELSVVGEVDGNDVSETGAVSGFTVVSLYDDNSGEQVGAGVLKTYTVENNDRNAPYVFIVTEDGATITFENTTITVPTAGTYFAKIDNTGYVETEVSYLLFPEVANTTQIAGKYTTLQIPVTLTINDLALSFEQQLPSGTWQEAMQALSNDTHVELLLTIASGGQTLTKAIVPLYKAELDSAAYAAAAAEAVQNEQDAPEPDGYYALTGELLTTIDYGLAMNQAFSCPINLAWRIKLTSDNTLTLTVDRAASHNALDVNLGSSLADDVTIESKTVAQIKTDDDVDAIYQLSSDVYTDAELANVLMAFMQFVIFFGMSLNIRCWGFIGNDKVLFYSVLFKSFTSAGQNDIVSGIERQAWVELSNAANRAYLYTRGGVI